MLALLLAHMFAVQLLCVSMALETTSAFSPAAVSNRRSLPPSLQSSSFVPATASARRNVYQRASLGRRSFSSSYNSNKALLASAGGGGDDQAAIVDPLTGSPPLSVTLEGDDYSYKDAIQRTLIWVGAAAVFGGGVWALAGSSTGEEFFAGYLVEQSLSVDNLFVFLLLFEYFKVPLAYQDRVLNWGIYGAIVMRAVMIGLGAAALKNFHAILLVFASILVYSSGKALFGGNDEDEDPSQNSIVKFSRNLINSTDEYDGDRFFTLVDGVRMATPLFICMVAVEISDVVFAVDSIPAVFGVTENPLVVFSSNIFAIMGLRSLYTILSKAATDLKYLEPAIALVLGFIGGKMIGEYFGYDIPTEVALSVVATLLGTGVGASVWDKQQNPPEEES